ncbi:MAG: hypothetical protein ACI9FU_001873 [Granulosicoccus sp.]|jgi:hypothetical protein
MILLRIEGPDWLMTSGIEFQSLSHSGIVLQGYQIGR